MQPTNSNSKNFSRLLTPDEVAAMLSISRATIYRLIAGRKIQFYKIGGGLRFRKEDVERFMEENKIISIVGS